MSTQISFNDEDLKAEIKSHWTGQGVTISEPTLNEMVQEVKSKQKEHTLEELKLILSELKMQLQPSTANDESSIVVTASSMLQGLKVERYLIAGYEEKTGPEVKAILDNFLAGASEKGRTVEQERLALKRDKDALVKRLKGAQERLAKISSFDESGAQILEITKDDKLNEQLNALAAKEYSALKRGEEGAPRMVGDVTESKLVNYTPEEIQFLNNIFMGSDSSNLLTHEMPVISKGKPTGRLKDVILWPRARFAYEKSQGRDNTKLYQDRYNIYFNYVTLNQQLIVSLRGEIQNLESLMNVSVKKMKVTEHFINAAREFEHTSGGSFDAERGQALIQKYQANVEQLAEEIMDKMNKDRVFYAEIRDIEKELSNLTEKQNSPEKIVGEEVENFDPEYIYNLWRKNKGVHEAGGQRQGAKVPSNMWNISSDNTKFIDPVDGEEKTWKLGHVLYQRFDAPSKKTMQDVRTLLTYRDTDTKITQPFEASAYDDPEILTRLEKLPPRGWGEDLKMRVAASAKAHWALLWNLGKQNITRDDFFSLLGINPQEYVSLPDGKKATMSQVFRQWPAVNSKAVRDQVVANPSTPDWVLMYMAQHEDDEQIAAKGKLEDRGWKVKVNANNEPETAKDGGWVWIKSSASKKASLKLGYREADLQTIQPMLDQLQNLQKDQQNQLKQQQTKTQPQIDALTEQIKQNLLREQTTKPTGQQNQTTNVAPAQGTAIPGGVAPTTPKANPMANFKERIKLSRRG